MEGLPGRAAFQRDPYIDDGPGGAVGAQGGGAGDEALHVLMENRNGLVVDVVLSQATGTAETEAALTMLERVPTARRITVRGRQGVRHAGVRDHLPLVRDHASRGYEATALTPGPADEPSCGVRGESAGAEAG